MAKRLYRSARQRMFNGVCGGIAEYFDIDPTIVRLVWVLGSIFFTLGFGGLLAYFVCALIIPEEPGIR